MLTSILHGFKPRTLVHRACSKVLDIMTSKNKNKKRKLFSVYPIKKKIYEHFLGLLLLYCRLYELTLFNSHTVIKYKVNDYLRNRHIVYGLGQVCGSS